VKTKRVQESGQSLHNQQHRKRRTGPHRERHEDKDDIPALDNAHEDSVPEHGGELGVGEGEGPETEVGGGVGDGSEDELDGVDDLVDHDLGELELFTLSVPTTTLVLNHRSLLVLLETAMMHALLVVVAQEKGFGEEHDGDANDGDDGQ